MSQFLHRTKKIVDHPLTHVLVGLGLIVSGGVEIYSDVVDESRRFQLGAHHGVVILGIVETLSALPDLVHGIERWLRAAEIAQASNREGE